MCFNSIAHVFEIFAREVLVDGFNFLQENDDWLLVVQPVRQSADAGLDAVDIEGRYAHGMSPG